MASTLDANKIQLIDNLPGAAPFGNVPRKDAAGLMGHSSHHNVASSPKGSPGEKITIRTDYGDVVLVYFQLGTQQGTLAAKGILGMQHASGVLDQKWTNKSSAALIGGPVIIAISAMTDNYYGWGVCGGSLEAAVSLFSALDGDYLTDGSVTIGSMSTVDEANVLGFCINVAAKLTAAVAGGSDA